MTDQPNDPSQPDPSQNPYGQPNPYGEQPPQYGSPAYGSQPTYGSQPGYPAQPGQPGFGQPPYGGGQPPAHPSATTSMVLGIIGLAGIMFCGGITLVLSPFAWVMGRKAVREIDANPGQYSARDQARGGQIMGIIGTVLLIIGLVLVIFMIVAMFAWWDTSVVDQSSDVEWESSFSG